LKRILVMGAAGQIGSELTPALRAIYGTDNVVASDIRTDLPAEFMESGPFEAIDCLDAARIADVIRNYHIDTVYNLVALLSAVGEANPQLSWKINIGGLINILEIAREMGLAVFTPSSIGAFGPTTPRVGTPQDTIQRPTSMYGVTKVTGELLCDYYHLKFGVDTRGVRYPGIISNLTPPGGGTTDYAVDIYYEAIKTGRYTCYLKAGSFLDMMYMPDCTNAAINLMEANPDRLIHRNAFNVAAFSVDPESIAASIRKIIPGFSMDYKIDPVRQSIADSWPDSMDDATARKEWDWNPHYRLDDMTADMLRVLGERFAK
jgi:nucleoside-diphosphate-sugar epimerase